MSPPPARTLQALGDRVGRLYTLPGVALRVMELTDQPDVDVPALKSAVENDPALTAKILRVVNSSVFSRTGEVADLNQALALLGIQPLKLLVLGFSLPETLFEGQDADVLARYWRRSLSKAVAAREISQRYWHVGGDEAFIGGLLDDLGQLVLLQQLKDRYVNFLRRVELEESNLEIHERGTLGFDHRQLSAELMRRWQLPESIAHAIESVRDVKSLRSLTIDMARLPQVLHLAELVADCLTRPSESSAAILALAGQVYREVSAGEMASLIRDVDQMVTVLAAAMETEIGDETSYCEIAAEAQARLAAEAENALGDVVQYHRTARDSGIEEEVWGEADALSDCLTKMLEWTDIGADEQDSGTRSDVTSTVPLVPEHAEVSLAQANVGVAGPSNATAEPIAMIHRSTESSIGPDVAAAATLCRAKQWSLSVVLFEADGIGDSMDIVTDACLSAPVRYSKVCPVHTSRLAWILPDCDRMMAVELAREVFIEVEAATSGIPTPTTIGAGVASVAVLSKNFESQSLCQSADRCLYAVLASGGSGVKSIDVF